MISKIVGAALNILVNKARDKAADSLNDGDVTSERFREIIVRELKDIKHKLDALCKKDLNASVDFYETGVHLLYDYFAKQRRNMQLHRKDNDNNDQLFGGRDEGSNDQPFGGKDKDSNDQLSEDDLSSQNQLAADGVSEQASGSTFVNYFRETFSLVADYFVKQNEAANEPQTEIAIPPNEKAQKPEKQHQNENTECLREAKRKFELAEEYATLAFNNEALKGFDRITAQKLRITATILMHLDTPHAAVACCKRYLEQLNSLRFVSEAFKVQEGEGLKAATRRFFNEDERNKVIETVKNINKVAFSFGRVVFPAGTELLKVWPNVIKTPKDVFPISVGMEVAKTWPLLDIAVNDNGIIACLHQFSGVYIFSMDGKLISSFDNIAKGTAREEAIALDADENVYISEQCYHLTIDSVGTGVKVFTKSGKQIDYLESVGMGGSLMFDGKNEMFTLTTEKEYQQKSLIEGRGKIYAITYAALKEALTNKNSTIHQFLEERNLVLDVARKENHEFVLLGPQWRGISVYRDSDDKVKTERITWNPTNGDVIHMCGNCMEIYENGKKSPFQFRLPFWHGIPAVTPDGPVVIGQFTRLYFF